MSLSLPIDDLRDVLIFNYRLITSFQNFYYKHNTSTILLQVSDRVECSGHGLTTDWQTVLDVVGDDALAL